MGSPTSFNSTMNSSPARPGSPGGQQQDASNLAAAPARQARSARGVGRYLAPEHTAVICLGIVHDAGLAGTAGRAGHALPCRMLGIDRELRADHTVAVRP